MHVYTPVACLISQLLAPDDMTGIVEDIITAAAANLGYSTVKEEQRQAKPL